ncbi:MAG: di-heme oxidoredictase family protein [Deltaproteobacteria bacterium]
MQTVPVRYVVVAWVGAAVVACSSSEPAEVSPAPLPTNTVDIGDNPISGISPQLEADFNDGDLLFGTPLRQADGLGPLYTRSACDSCHADDARGPGLVSKMSVVEADGVTPAADQSMLSFGHTVHPLGVAGAYSAALKPTPILPPQNQANVKVTTRLGPPVIGRGYIEAIADSEIERVAAEQAARGDEIHGRINRVAYGSEANEDTLFHSYQKGQLVIGRFGLKARVATLDDFTADAFQGDMGITSPLRPVEFLNPDGLTDDDKPGVDVDYRSVNLRALYIRLLAIPARKTSAAGAALFASSDCAACHVPSLATRTDYPIEKLAGIDAEVYSDLLLHRMGSALADGLPSHPSVDGAADSFEWRTAPLIGLRFNRTFLHDGRAKSIEEAVLMHRGEGSEANRAVDGFEALPDTDRQTLLEFVEAL